MNLHIEDPICRNTMPVRTPLPHRNLNGREKSVNLSIGIPAGRPYNTRVGYLEWQDSIPS
jgi:hypothetical protein